jgi:hypothetical protein
MTTSTIQSSLTADQKQGISSNYSIDVRLLETRKSLELASINASKETDYEKRYSQIECRKKYDNILEALEGLYLIGVHHSVSLKDIIDMYHTI